MANSSFYSGTGTNPTDVDSITSSKTAAETAATNAATSEANAATSATNAAASATDASNSASSISGSVAAAASSATDSANSATSSSTSATQAATSASNAAASATSASTSAASATSSASSSADSALDASGSATAAASSATSASTSASNAATSEANAATSASQAATSASTAQAAATNTDVATVSSNVSYVQTVADNISDVETVSNNVLKINTVADNISDVLGANTASTQAISSAADAASSATQAASSATSAATSASTATAAKDAALEALDNFDDRYLGQKASDPTVDNDGDALVAGALYFDTTTDTMKVYDGSIWVAAYASLSGALIAANNLSDVANVTTARTNLGLGTAATTASTDYATAAQGTLADTSVQPNDSPTFGSITVTGTVDGRDVAADGATLDAVSTTYLPFSGGTLTGDLNITGTLTSDGLTVDGDITLQKNNPVITIADTGTTNQQSFIRQLSGTLYFDGQSGATTDGSFLFRGYDGSTNKMLISYNGDISFYEDTGTTPKFFWDASAESLGIGTTTPNGELQVLDNSSNCVVNFTSAAGSITALGLGDVDDLDNGAIWYSNADNSMRFYANAGERMRIDGSGKVGIGVTSINSNVQLHVSGNIAAASSSVYADAYKNWGTNLILDSESNLPMLFKISGTERMRIDSSGRVGIGTSSPAEDLDINAANATLRLDAASNSQFGNPTLQFLTNAGNNDYINFGDIDDADVGQIGYVHSADYMLFQTNASERMRIDSSGNVGVTGGAKVHFGSTTDSSSHYIKYNSGANGLEVHGYGSTIFTNYTGTERMRIDSSGNLLVNQTATGDYTTTVGSSFRASGFSTHTADENAALLLNRLTSDGDIAIFRKDNSTVGSIGSYFTNSVRYLYIAGASPQECGIGFYANGIYPSTATGSFADNSKDLGVSSIRWDDIYATNGTINTSDEREKQDIDVLSEAEQNVAVAAKGLLRKFRWRDAVEEKGDEARTHFGIIAQDLQAAFEAEGLDAGDYAMFIHSTWTDEETGEERSRMGVRYSELLAFIIAAI